VYVSFAGLPEKSIEVFSRAGEQFKAGEIRAGKNQLLAEFHKAGLKPPIIHKGWFNELTPNDVPDQIAFAFLDGDFYDSILDSLQLVWPNLAPNAVITIDDFARDALPGPERAVKEFLKDKSYKSLHAEHNIGIIRL
jgi:O-methyltransferase